MRNLTIVVVVNWGLSRWWGLLLGDGSPSRRFREHDATRLSQTGQSGDLASVRPLARRRNRSIIDGLWHDRLHSSLIEIEY